MWRAFGPAAALAWPCPRQVGPDGVLSIESGSGLETTVEVEEGMEIDRGYISPQFVTNNERLTVEMENVRVLITDQKIEKVSELIPLLEKVTRLNAPLFIIAEDITGEALATLVVNKMRGIISVVAIKAPGFGERRKALLQDIAIVTGAEFVAKDLGLAVETTDVDALGYIRKLTARAALPACAPTPPRLAAAADSRCSGWANPRRCGRTPAR